MNADIHLLMSLYQVIVTHGSRTEDGHEMDGITVSSGPDGYELYFKADGVQYRLGFHNTLWQEWDSQTKREAFLKKARHLVNNSQAA